MTHVVAHMAHLRRKKDVILIAVEPSRSKGDRAIQSELQVYDDQEFLNACRGLVLLISDLQKPHTFVQEAGMPVHLVLA